MALFDKIKQWFALRKAKEEEVKKLPLEEDLKKEHEHFEEEATELKRMVTSKKKPRKTRKYIKHR